MRRGVMPMTGSELQYDSMASYRLDQTAKEGEITRVLQMRQSMLGCLEL